MGEMADYYLGLGDYFDSNFLEEGDGPCDSWEVFCRCCGQRGLRWKRVKVNFWFGRIEWRWRLFDPYGTPHNCPKNPAPGEIVKAKAELPAKPKPEEEFPNDDIPF